MQLSQVVLDASLSSHERLVFQREEKGKSKWQRQRDESLYSTGSTVRGVEGTEKAGLDIMERRKVVKAEVFMKTEQSLNSICHIVMTLKDFSSLAKTVTPIWQKKPNSNTLEQLSLNNIKNGLRDLCR